MSATNFDRAVTRMRARGNLPFTTDGSSARTLRWLPDQRTRLKLSDNADRMDAIIAAFCIGVALGMLIAAPTPEAPAGYPVAESVQL